MKERLTPSLVISVLALIVALGGVSYAAIKIPKNSVGSKQLKKNSVTAAKIKKNAVTGVKVKAGAITGAKLGADSVDSSKVTDGSLLRNDFQTGQINGDAYYAQGGTDGLVPLTNAFTPVVTTQVLPAGSYVLEGRANLLGGAGASSVICSMETDAAQNVTIAAGVVFPLAMSAVAVLNAPEAISMSCLKNGSSVDVAQTHIIATSVNSIAGFTPGG